jgi:hypothetical protein
MAHSSLTTPKLCRAEILDPIGSSLRLDTVGCEATVVEEFVLANTSIFHLYAIN